jgi:hypothetical protein
MKTSADKDINFFLEDAEADRPTLISLFYSYANQRCGYLCINYLAFHLHFYTSFKLWLTGWGVMLNYVGSVMKRLKRMHQLHW